MTPGTTEEVGKRPWKGINKKHHLAISSKGGKNAWTTMTPGERPAGMNLRAVVRAENAKKKARAEARVQKKTKGGWRAAWGLKRFHAMKD